MASRGDSAAGRPEPGSILEDQGAALAFLADPATQDGCPVEVVETHGAWVFIAGDRFTSFAATGLL